jgi:spermidine/putrescine ABC transporter ATP-binding subunit
MEASRFSTQTVRAEPGHGAKVSLVDLEKRFDGVGAVCGISLEIASGEFLTLLGPSGSGKTTTLMMIAGFETPTNGDIAIDGRSVIGTPPYKRNIGMVFQSYALFPHLTVGENIAFPLKQRGIDRASRERLVGASLAMVQLAGYQTRYPRQLSGGQQQRVALARAIVFRPRLLLMDEPLGALDKQLRENLQLEMRRLHAELGITFVYVTHDQGEALTMSDRIAVMNEGRIAQLGSPQDLYDRPVSRFVASFIGESNFFSGVVHATEAGLVVAKCGASIVRGVAARLPPVGGAVTLTVRPERMRFAEPGAPPADGENRIRATVAEAMFAGERCRYLLHQDDGEPLVLKEPSGAATRRRATGEVADVVWPVADTAVV